MNKNPLSQPIRGARDLYPKELAIRDWIFNQWRGVARSFGYEEINGPVLESFNLFAAKSGEELVNGQMYALEDRDGKKLGVRPEITPTYSRMIAKNQGQLIFPLRWTMFGNVWRYEKPQSGRSRDFWQWELNIVGGNETMADAEVLTVMAKALESLNITSDEVVIRINDRRFMQQVLLEIGINDNMYPLVLKIIDRKDKISESDYSSALTEIGLNNEQILRLNEFLSGNSKQSSEKINNLMNLLNKYGVDKYVKFDPLVVRGLAYYTGTVFECFEKTGSLKRSIFGGGRFDDLVETFGGGKIGAVGFAISDVVIMELLKQLGKFPDINPVPTKVLVTVFSPDLYSPALQLSCSLRNAGINCELYPEPVKLEKQLKYANAKGIPYVAILGPEEVSNNIIKLKDMKSTNQKELKIEELVDLLKIRN